MESPSSSKRSRSNGGSPEHSPKRLKRDQVEGNLEELYFLLLMNEVLNTVIKLKDITENDLSDAITRLKQNFRNFHDDPSFKYSDFDLSHWVNSCAYLYCYGSHGAGLARHKTLEALQNCNNFESILKNPKMNIISLGGGPGNDIIGFCSALYERGVPQESLLNITLVDSMKEWSLFMDYANDYIKEGYYGYVSDLFKGDRVKLRFLHAELPGSPDNDKEYFQSLAKADVILMHKLFSILKMQDKENIAKSLYNNMNDDALILFIDSYLDEGSWKSWKFEILYPPEFKKEAKYISSATFKRFGWNDEISSVARAVVMRKKPKESSVNN